MDTLELKKEQQKLSQRITIKDDFSKIDNIAGTFCVTKNNKLIATVVVFSYPNLEFIEKKIYVLDDPLPYKPGFRAYHEMPAIIEAINSLDNEPDLILVFGLGINHPRKIGLASHLGLALNIPTISISDKLLFGKLKDDKIILNNEIVGTKLITKEHSNPIYVSPGYKISLKSSIKIIKNTLKFPNKLPNPIHIARKIAKKYKKNNI